MIEPFSHHSLRSKKVQRKTFCRLGLSLCCCRASTRRFRRGATREGRRPPLAQKLRLITSAKDETREGTLLLNIPAVSMRTAQSEMTVSTRLGGRRGGNNLEMVAASRQASAKNAGAPDDTTRRAIKKKTIDSGAGFRLRLACRAAAPPRRIRELEAKNTCSSTRPREEKVVDFGKLKALQRFSRRLVGRMENLERLTRRHEKRLLLLLFFFF